MRPPASTRSRRIELVAGILLGLVLGVVVAYLLVIVVGGGKDASNISTTTAPSGAETRSGSSGKAAP